MKQSTLDINYTSYVACFTNLASYTFDKEAAALICDAWIYSKGEIINITLSIGNYVHIDIGETKFRLTFKDPYDYSKFLEANETELSNFKITKLAFKDIQGI